MDTLRKGCLSEGMFFLKKCGNFAFSLQMTEQDDNPTHGVIRIDLQREKKGKRKILSYLFSDDLIMEYRTSQKLKVDGTIKGNKYFQGTFCNYYNISLDIGQFSCSLFSFSPNCVEYCCTCDTYSKLKSSILNCQLVNTMKGILINNTSFWAYVSLCVDY